jgi:pimeloyl-ACP methyl ester carboxylesterase
VIPSRRSDPQRTIQARTNLADTFRERLPAELLKDEGPNQGTYSHRNHEAELTLLIENLAAIVGPDVDNRRVGILGDSAGGGVALVAASKLGERVDSIALLGSALKTSQWFYWAESRLVLRGSTEQTGCPLCAAGIPPRNA